MAEYNLNSATTTNFTNSSEDFIVASKALDNANQNGETYVYFDKAQQNFGYYFTIPEIYSAANALATWAVGKGWSSKNPRTKVILEHITGMGKDTFDTIMWNHLVTKLIVGDAFIKLIRKDGVLVNMLPISPERVKVVLKNNRIIRYEIYNGDEWVKEDPKDILHSQNNRIGDQIHGTSQIDASKFIIDARNEALADERIIKHRDKALGIAYYDTDIDGKISYANGKIEDAVNNGEMLGLPKDTIKIEPYPSRSSEDRQPWIQYLENFFYQVFGVPRSIATSDGTSEVGGKMGHVIFEPVYTRQQTELEGNLWNQAQILIKFNRPPSLGGLVQDEEAKNTGQTRIQPNDSVVNLNRE